MLNNIRNRRLAWRSPMPNKSLDASGGSVFLNLLGAAEGALIRAAASTPPWAYLRHQQWQNAEPSMYLLLCCSRWPAVLVLLGGVWNLLFVGTIVLYAFLWSGDNSGLSVVFADLLIAMLTMVLACVNIVRNDPYLFGNSTVEQIVGRERREREKQG
jgi:hypothetical protein